MTMEEIQNTTRKRKSNDALEQGENQKKRNQIRPFRVGELEKSKSQHKLIRVSY